MKSLTTFLLFLFCSLSAMQMQAQTATLSVQGILKKNDGSAVPDGLYNLKIGLYTAEVGGTEAWNETINNVETTGGVYSVVLGLGTPGLTAAFNVPYYLSVKILPSNQELLPRPRLTAAPYALSIMGAQNIVPSTGNIQAYGMVTYTDVTVGNDLYVDHTIKINGGPNGNGGMLSTIGPLHDGPEFHGYGFTGDGNTGVSSNSYGMLSLWASGVNVMNATNDELTVNTSVTFLGIKPRTYSTPQQIRSVLPGSSSVDLVSAVTTNFSLIADDYIKATGLYVVSDRRTKKDFSLSNAARDLSLLQQLRVTDYKYKDVIAKGDVWKKGVIAQEVEQVVPQAVSTSTEVIPDIYALAKNTELQAGKLHITMEQAHGLKSGDKVRLIAGEHQQDLLVAATPSATEFSVDNWIYGAPENVFVYGHEVNDFHSVDYDRLFTLNISATQELARRLELLEKENAAYKAENTDLRQVLEGLRADVNVLKAQR